MLFSSFTFLCYFLPTVIGIYYVLPNRLRNLFLLAASFVFYGWGHPYYLLLLLYLTLIGFYSARWIKYYPTKACLICLGACFYILSVFTFFKYGDFTLETVNLFLKTPLPLFEIILPLGISFYVFQLISYIIDVYHSQVEPQKKFATLALYIASFPQLVAGPIVRYHTVASQLASRRHSVLKVYQGFRRFVIGLSKKVIIADMMSRSVDLIFDSSVSSLTPLIAWLGAFLYALQIYFDFSGYSDMAIGLGRMFGFRFLENFNYPYVSKSISEFWRRWHISLSSWFKSYVYIPLGGNRKGLLRTIFNLSLVFLLTGLWHGAAWTMILWGGWQGIFVIFEKLLKNLCMRFGFETKIFPLFYETTGRVYTIIVLLFGWVIFRSETVKYAYDYIRLMLGLIPYTQAFGISYYLPDMLIGLIVVAVLASLGLFRRFLHYRGFLIHLFLNVYLLALLCLVFVLLMGNGYNPFIYFRF